MVATERKLGNVFPKVLTRDMNMCASDRTLQLTPMPFDGVGVMNAVHPFLGAVVHGAVLVRADLEDVVTGKFVRRNRAARRNGALDYRAQSFLRHIRDRPSDHATVALDQTHDDGLVRHPVFVALFQIATADQRLVDFHMTRQRAVAAIRRRHQLAKLVRHAPRRLVGAADLPLQFLRRNAVTRAGHQVHGKKPVRQLRAGLVKNRVRARVNVVAAFLAGVGLPGGHGVKLGLDSAPRANQFRAPEFDPHKGSKAGGIVRELGLELLERIFHGGSPSLVMKDTPYRTCCQGINA